MKINYVSGNNLIPSEKKNEKENYSQAVKKVLAIAIPVVLIMGSAALAYYSPFKPSNSQHFPGQNTFPLNKPSSLPASLPMITVPIVQPSLNPVSGEAVFWGDPSPQSPQKNVSLIPQNELHSLGMRITSAAHNSETAKSEFKSMNLSHFINNSYFADKKFEYSLEKVNLFINKLLSKPKKVISDADKLFPEYQKVLSDADEKKKSFYQPQHCLIGSFFCTKIKNRSFPVS